MLRLVMAVTASLQQLAIFLAEDNTWSVILPFRVILSGAKNLRDPSLALRVTGMRCFAFAQHDRNASSNPVYKPGFLPDSSRQPHPLSGVQDNLFHPAPVQSVEVGTDFSERHYRLAAVSGFARGAPGACW